MSPNRLWCPTNTIRSLFYCTKILVTSEIIASNDFVMPGFEYYGWELYSVIVTIYFSNKNAFLSIILYSRSNFSSLQVVAFAMSFRGSILNSYGKDWGVIVGKEECFSHRQWHEHRHGEHVCSGYDRWVSLKATISLCKINAMPGWKRRSRDLRYLFSKSMGLIF